MQLPIVTETSALSAHRREVELVRMSLMAVPEHSTRRGPTDPCDPLRAVDSSPFRSHAKRAARRSTAQ